MARSGVPFGLFRILFGACLSLDIAGLMVDAPFWFDPVPYGVSAGPWPRWILGGWLLAALSLTAGYRTRIAALCNYGFCVAVLGFGGMRYGYEYHPDGLYLLTSFGIIFLPVSARLSLDAMAVGKRSVSSLPFAFLACVASSIYLDSGLWKLSSELWVNGLGYWLPAVQPTDALVSIPWTFENRWLAIALSHVTLAYELLFPALIWFRRLRWPLLAIGFGLHLGVATVIPLPFFGLLMCAILVGLIPSPVEPERSAAATSRPQRPVPLPRPLALAAVSGLTAAFLMCLAEPIAALRTRGLGASSGPNATPWPAKKPPVALAHQRALVWSYRLFGIRSHPIFLDSAFADYTVDRRLVYVPNAPQEGGAATDEGHRFYPANRNRHYVSWHYRSVWPMLDRPSMQAKLIRFVRFHAHQSALDLTEGEVRLQRRPMRLPVEGWRPGQRSANLEQQWKDEATFEQNETGGLWVTWLMPPEKSPLKPAAASPGHGQGQSRSAGSPVPQGAATGTPGTTR